jgi:hypothetical protein
MMIAYHPTAYRGETTRPYRQIQIVEMRADLATALLSDREVFMSRVIYLPASKKPPTRAQAQVPDRAVGKCRPAHAQRLAHDLKNCMSALFLGLATLERDGDGWKISARSQEVFEDVVLEMDRIVNELIHSTQDAKLSDRPAMGDRVAPPQGATN